MKKIVILGGYGDGIVVASALKDIKNRKEDVIPFGFLSRSATWDERPVSRFSSFRRLCSVFVLFLFSGFDPVSIWV